MLLVTKEIEAALLSAASNGERPPAQTPILCKLFTPDANATWYVTEAERREDGELVLFGWCDLGDRELAELGSVLLSEIASVRGGMGLPVERDLYLPAMTLADVLTQYGKNWG